MNCRVFVLEFDKSSGISWCYHKDSYSLVKIKIHDGNDPSPGFWISYDNNQKADNNGITHLPYHSNLFEKPTDGDCFFEHEGRLTMSAWIGFSGHPHHLSYNRKVAFCDWYGLVDCSEMTISPRHRVYGSYIVLNDLDYVANGTRLFKVIKVKGPITKKTKKEDVDKFLENLVEYEEGLIGKNKRETAVQRTETTRSSPVNRVATPSQMANLGDGFRQPTSPINDRLLSPILVSNTSSDQMQPLLNVVKKHSQQRNIDNQTSVISPFHSVDLNGRQLVCMDTSDSNSHVVWLYGLNQGATIDRNCPGFYDVQLGRSYMCHVQKVSDEWVVKKLISVINAPPPFRMRERERCFEAEFSVDLCSPNSKFSWWSIYTSIVVLTSPDAGFILTADKVTLPNTPQPVKTKKVMRQYMGDPLAMKMRGYCRLEEHRIPKGLVENDYEGTETIRKFVWVLYEVIGTEAIVKRREEAMIETNFPWNASRIQENDSIAQQKRLNREMEQLRMEQSTSSYGLKYDRDYSRS